MPAVIPQRGIRKVSPIIALAAAITPLALYTIPAGRSAIIRKIKYNNLHTTQTGLLRIGLCAVPATTPVLEAVPSVQVLNNSTGGLDEQDGIPSAVINAAVATIIYAETSANLALAPAAVMNVQIEVEEYPAA